VTFSILPVVLILAVLVPLFLASSAPVGATNTTDLTTVRTYVAAYIAKQYVVGDAAEGDTGFVRDRDWLRARIDSNGDMNTTSGAGVLGEGDDPANAPLLIDTLNQTGVVPGTSLQCAYNSGSGGAAGTGTTNCFDSAELALVKTKLDARAAAGFSTDMVTYCATQHTGSPATGGWGYIAQTGGLRSDGSIPNVYNMKWGRAGWVGTAASYANVNTTAAPSASPGYAPPSSAAPACADSDPLSTAGDFDLVRCQAQWAIYATAINGAAAGGNVGNGQNPTGTAPSMTLTGGQIVDIRTGSPASVSIAGKLTINDPINEIFTSAGLAKINPAPTGGVIVVGRTQMTSGVVAMGLKMLGYSMGTGGYMKSGMPNWNNTLNEKQNTVALSPAYPTPAPAGVIDVTTPVINSGPTVSNITKTTADISRTTSEPATSKIHLTGNHGEVVDFNNTILNATKTVPVSGLHASTSYTGTLTVYDGQANSTSAAVSFTTAPDTTLPAVSNILPAGSLNTSALSFPVTISADYADDAGGSGIKAESAMVHLDVGNMLMDCPVQTASHVECNANTSDLTTGTHSIDVYVEDNAGNGDWFHGSVTIVDDRAPAVTYLGPGAPGASTPINSTSFTITGTYNDAAPSSGIASAVASLNDGVNWTIACTATGGNISCPVTTSSNQTVHAKIKVTDNAGNAGLSNSAELSIDTAAPITHDNAPVGWQSADVTVTLSCSDAFTGCDTTSYSVNGGGVQTGNASFPNTVPVLVNAEGDTAIEYWSVDKAGNAESPHQTVHVKIDKSGPTIAYDGPSGYIKATGTTVTGTSSDAISGINAGSGKLSLDGTASFPYGCSVAPNGDISCDVAGLTDGSTYHAAVSVSDNAGWVSNSSPVTDFTVDATPPATTDDAPAGWQKTDVTVHLNCFDATSGCNSTDWSADNGGGSGSGNTIVLSNEGLTTITYHSTDNAGNSEGDRTEFVRIDKTPPVTTSGGDIDWTNSDVTVAFGCSDAGSGCNVVYWLTNQGESGSGLLHVTKEGDSLVTYYGVDYAGNEESPNTMHVKLDKTAPTITNNSPVGTFASTSQTISADYSDGGANPFLSSSLAPIGVASGINTSSVAVVLDGSMLSGCTVGAGDVVCNVFGLSDGTHDVTVDVRDNAGNPAVQKAWSFTINTAAPNITNWYPTGVTNETTPVVGIGYTASGTIAGSAISVDGSDCTATWNQTAASCSPALADGVHNAHGEATVFGVPSATVDWSFTKDSQAPVTADDALPGWQNVDFTVTLSCSDATTSCASTTYSLDGGAPQTGNSVAINPEGDHVIAYYSTDIAGNEEASHTVSAQLDKTKPQSTNNAPSGWQTSDVSFNLGCTDNLSGCDSTSFVTDGGPWLVGNTVNLTSDGYHMTYYYSLDRAGNAEFNQLAEVKIDKTAPVTTDNAQSGWQNQSTIQDVTLSCDDNLSGCASTVYSVDGGAQQTGDTVHIDTAGDHTVVYHSVDVAGVAEADHTTHVKLDLTPPVTTDNTPAGWQKADFDVTLSCGDGDPGINSGCGFVVYSIDGGPNQFGPVNVVDVMVPINTDGDHVITYFSTDKAGNNETPHSVHAQLDKSGPLYGNALPNGWSHNAAPNITVEMSDGLSNVDPSKTSVTIDSSPVDVAADCTQTGTEPVVLSCSKGIFGEGAHGVSVSSTDLAGNASSTSWQFSVDITAPVISNNDPVGGVTTSTPTLSVDLTDSGAGVDLSSAIIAVDGVNLSGCTQAPISGGTHMQCPATIGSGSHNVVAYVADYAFNASVLNWQIELTQRNYYFPWFDNDPAGGMNGDWLMITNTGDITGGVDIYIGGALVFQFDGGSAAGHGPKLAPGEQVNWKTDTQLTAGPVRIVSTDGQELLVTQRVIFKDSFNEIAAVEENQLDKDYFFTWYDNNASWGMNGNWILAANMGSTATDIKIYVGEVLDGSTPAVTFPDVAPGAIVTWQSPTTRNEGPVRVVSSGQQLLVSQRVIFKDAFNEVLGASRNHLDTEGYFTWYDNEPSWGMKGNWVLATNVGAIDTTVEIYINSISTNPVATLGPMAPGQTIAWQSPTPLTDGPVRALSTNAQTLLVSERTIFKNSFEEVQGITPVDMGGSYLFNFYDSKSDNHMKGDWLLTCNYGDIDFDANIAIGGTLMVNPDPGAGGSTVFPVASHSSIFPQFNEKMSGPVAVQCSGCSGFDDFLSSQRVIYKDSFNEVVGKGYKPSGLPAGWDIIITVPEPPV